MQPEDHSLFKDDQSLREHLEAIRRHAEAAAQLCDSHLSTPIIKKNVPIVKLPEHPEIIVPKDVPIVKPLKYSDKYKREDVPIVKLPEHLQIIVPVENVKNDLGIDRNIAKTKRIIPTAIAGIEDFSKPPLAPRPAGAREDHSNRLSQAV